MFSNARYLRPVVVAALAATVIASAQAFAGITNHEPGTYKMTKFGKTGENIPLNGPVIHVFSKDGKKYTSIANDNQKLKHASRVGGICDRRTHKFRGASVTVAGESHSVSGTGSRSMKTHTESFKFPFTLPDIPRSPTAACNHELDKRVSTGNKSREYWMSRGFVVRYENAYEARFAASCSGGLAKGDFVSKTIETPVWIACAPAEAVAESRPDRKPTVPARKPKSPKARPMALKIGAKLEADNPGTVYSKECPVRVKYTGTIYVNKPNTKVVYQVVGSDWDSPERTITVDKPGFVDITSWTQYYREKAADTGRFATTGSGSKKTPDNKGSVKLTVKSGKTTATSDPIPYEIYCNADKPLQLKTRKTN